MPLCLNFFEWELVSNHLCTQEIFCLQLVTIANSLYHKNFERKSVNIFFNNSFKICFGHSKEPSHLDGSFEYPQHMFWLRNKKFNFLVRTLN